MEQPGSSLGQGNHGTVEEKTILEKPAGNEEHGHNVQEISTIQAEDAGFDASKEKTALESEITDSDEYLSPPDHELNGPRKLSDDFRFSSDSEDAARVLGPASRPDNSRGNTTVSVKTTGTQSLPTLRRKETKLAQKEAHPWQHLGITLGLPMILLFDILIPCIIYYTWYNNNYYSWQSQCREEFPNQICPIERPQFDEHILGYAIICFGFGELWILFARVYRLFAHRDECAPLLSRSKWEFDATSWVYAVAMILALIPFVIGSSLVMPTLYLYSPSFIMGFLGILMVVTTFFPFKIPIGINSQPRGTRLRPFIYYAAEDFIAVDGLQDREFRVRYNDRYESNKMFRNFLRNLTLWWILGVCVYEGCVSAVIFTMPFHIAFGLSLGVLFAYIAVWAAVSVVWTNIEMKREHKAYEEGNFEA